MIISLLINCLLIIKNNINNQQLFIYQNKNLTYDSFNGIDWRLTKHLSPIQNQGKCGGCWAFASIDLLESMYSIKYNNFIGFSKQNMISCNLLNNGCLNGYISVALKWLKENKGICLEKDYKFNSYYGETTSCDYCTNYPNTDIKKYYRISGNNNNLEKLLKYSPILSSINMDNSKFDYYHNGIISINNCSNVVNHAVLIVGFGFDIVTNKKYWIVKNSWGKDWGEKGYFRLDYQNDCGLLTNIYLIDL